MATHYYLRIRANQAFNMSVQSFSYSENKQVAKGWIVVTAKTLYRWRRVRNKVNVCPEHNINFSSVTEVT